MLVFKSMDESVSDFIVYISGFNEGNVKFVVLVFL